jgi:hypothetical protein
MNDPPEIKFELRLRPAMFECDWHVTLEYHDNGDRSKKLEFDSPLELARHLAELGFQGWKEPNSRKF